MKKFILAGLLCLIFSCAKAEAVTITNGSFENDFTGWYLTYGNIDLVGGWQASDGTYSIDLSGNTAGGIAQTIDTMIGQQYLVTFDLSGNPGYPLIKTLIVNAASASQTYTYTLSPDMNNDNMKWQTQSFYFTAEKEQTELSFNSQDYTCYGPVLDNVKISEYSLPSAPTPEPSSLLLGFTGLTGLLGLKKRR